MLRDMLMGKNVHYFMEAHDAISAKIIAEVGYSGIWTSSLAISSSMGYRDCNEISWSMMLERAEQIKDSINIPVIVDADSGYGNFNNARLAAKKFEKSLIDGMCIEDKLFPKTNSFVNSKSQALEDVDVFCGKIKAIKDFRRKHDFCIIARVESLIVGDIVDNALKRAYAYVDAGADAILIHSKKRDKNEIKSFIDRWNSITPLIVVPTTYSLEKEDIENTSVRIVIWANHMIRASIHNMKKVAKLMKDNNNSACVEKDVIGLQELLDYQGVQAYLEDEKKYL